MSIKESIKKIVQGKRYSSDAYVNFLRKIGVTVGEDVIIYVPSKTLIDEQYPWMISIGNHVRITEGVKLLTHDYSWSVLKTSYGGILGASGCVSIGDNVFIGMNTIITKNVCIDSNVIIGAGSVVTKDCEANSVYAGSPAKKIMSLEEFFEKRIKAQVEEARLLAIKYYEHFGEKPKEEIFHEYFMLFADDRAIQENIVFSNKMDLCKNRNLSLAYITEHKPPFQNFNEFMRYCFDD